MQHEGKGRRMTALTPAEYGAQLAATKPPLTLDEVEAVSRTFVALDAEARAA